ncbi:MULTISPECIES: 2'-5' RNA ligase family protein [unclassified Paenibacillus]|uniref:2'-5' RNA ligase family protein n=1 Tax=unclassified Paenibacillus TaxID=185978 RepID=UPI00070951D7|nr:MULTISPECIES: 2'-5' RNA ligase family protein [unclassified Paenibacillus]KQX51234.1 2'-5' RNA ligase [Paenibacillus sp. Root444D2]KRE44265.1 2'-5' RNA ligase [Paenibacillus sp. Soil724D2]
MQYFIGIVPPDEYKEQIAAFRNRWVSNRLKDVVEPHITVKAQGGLTEDTRWLDNVREICTSIKSFRLSMSGPATFGSAVIFLGVESEEIYVLHKLLVDKVSPSPELIDRYFELGRFHPHLTLGQTYWGMNENEIAEMKLAAIHDLAPFPTFQVNYVRIYKEIEQNKYEPFEDIQFVR